MDYSVASELIRSFQYDDAVIPRSGLPTLIAGVSSIANLQAHTISFASRYKDSYCKSIQESKGCILFLIPSYKEHLVDCASVLIYCANPRFEYARTIQSIIDSSAEPFCAAPKDISRNPRIEIGENVRIDPRATISDDVVIGSNSIIMSGAVINSRVRLGESCIVRENAVIGGYGFGMDKDEEGNNFRVPHLGGVVIEDNVEIGALTTVCRGTIEDTHLCRFVKIDDHCHIGHNVHIGKNSILTAGVIIGGSVSIDDSCWIGLNATIRDGLRIGACSKVSMGAVVISNVPANTTVSGNPAVDHSVYLSEFLELTRRSKRARTRME